MGQRDILTLYKRLLRESKKFSSYSYREYAYRRIKDGFKENKHITNEEQNQEQYELALDSLKIIERQVIINRLYAASPLVIEK